MRVELIILSILQSILLAIAQVILKFALMRMGPFAWNKGYFQSLLYNWRFALCGICFAAASLLWIYIVKHFPLSIAYPMVSLSYIFGMIAAIIFFHETVDLWKWIGVFLIMTGCFLIAR